MSKCKRCKKKTDDHRTDVQESSTDHYLYRNAILCNDCIDDLIWADYRVRTARDDNGGYLY